MKKLFKKISIRTTWHVLAGFLPGVLIGLVIGVLGMLTLAPGPNVPPPHQDNSPGAVTIQLSQGYLSTIAAQNLNGTSLTVAGTLENVKAQPEPGDQLFITGQVIATVGGTQDMRVALQPCVTKVGRPSLDVTNVEVGGTDLTSTTGPTIQQKINSTFQNMNLSIPDVHLARTFTTANALLLIYSSSGSGGQPACHSG